MRFNRNDENYVYGFVGKNIKKYRKLKGLTQDELAELVNYSPSFIANIESSTHQTFSLGALWRIATALGVSLNEICHDSNRLGSANLESIDYICSDCSYNFTYLNKYVESNSFSIDFILNLKVEYYRYLKIALYNKGTKFMHEFLNTILANLNHYNFNLINEIIADLSGNLSSFTLTKTDIFNLLNLGVSGDIITNLFRYYYFSESEKLEIYHIFRSQNRDDLIITFSLRC